MNTPLRPGEAAAWVGLGANLGDPVAAFGAALKALHHREGCRVVAVSPLYRTAPLDAQGPDFLNAVALAHTRLAPLDLLDVLQGLEQAAGRERPYRNAPRTLDLDLLLHGDAVLQTERLVLPHPRLSQRAFVLAPLVALCPDLRLPGLGPATRALAALGDQAIEKLQAAPGGVSWPPPVGRGGSRR